jgi:hypothetical protein
MGENSVLLIYYSMSHQTKGLLRAMADGLSEEGITVRWEEIKPLNPPRFPFGSVLQTLKMMWVTFFRSKYPIAPLGEHCFVPTDLIILGGPTWSYNPSGPILALFQQEGDRLFAEKKVLPLISCRGYWRTHWFGLRSLLCKSRATIVNRIVFSHPSKEPWRTLGVFLKLSGKVPEKMNWLRPRYRRYGHTKEQVEEARRFGRMIGKCLRENGDFSALDFHSAVAVP